MVFGVNCDLVTEKLLHLGLFCRGMSNSLGQTECDDGRRAFFPLVARWQALGPNKRRHSIAVVEEHTHLEPPARHGDEHVEPARSKRYRANTGDGPIDLAQTPQQIQRRNSCPAVFSVHLTLLSQHTQIQRSRSSDSSQGECAALLRLLLTPSRDTGRKDLPAAHATMNSRVRPACEQNAGRNPQVLPACWCCIL